MAYKLKVLFGKRLVIFAFALSLVLPIAYAPTFAPRAQAFLGIGDINLESIPTIIKFILTTVGKSIANKIVDDMVQSTIKWANSGFDGNPAYITDTKKYFGDIASGVVGDAIGRSGVGFLCSPFQAQVRLALVRQYTQESARPQCTLEQIGVNLDNFYQDFDEGGWEAWIKVTQEDGNNPYGSYLALDSNIRTELYTANTDASEDKQANSGFLSWKDCVLPNPAVPDEAYEWYVDDEKDPRVAGYLAAGWDPDKEPGVCLKEGPVKTPGSVISAQLNNSFASGLNKLISADDIDALASAFLSGLLNRYVFSENGVFADNSSTASREEVIDVDGDKIPDGYDTDGDGELNICHNGTKDSSLPPSNANCIGSKNATNSPFFIPICKNIATTINSLGVFFKFISANRFHEDDANLWRNKIIRMSSDFDNLVTTISGYDARAWDQPLRVLSKYSDFVGKILESLAKDGDLQIGFLGSNQRSQRILVRNARNMSAYLQRFSDAIGQCNNPDIAAINDIPPPDIDPGSATTTTPYTDPDGNATSTPPIPIPDQISCSPIDTVAGVGNETFWYVDSTYPSGTAYGWEGDEVDTLALKNRSANTSFGITYLTPGVKSMRASVYDSGGNYVSATNCSETIMVTPFGFQQ
ncbi:MAG: hypothetical protein AAB660_00240 [Patescibacteria group bacterium]